MLIPSTGRAQESLGYALPDVIYPTPLASTHPSEGIYFWGDFIMYQQTIPIGDQTVALRGFNDLDGSITGVPRTFIGTGKVALTTKQVTGPSTDKPGWRIGLGYHFFDGGSIDVSWTHLLHADYRAVATPITSNLVLGTSLSDTFMFSPVNNFPLDFSGPAGKLNGQSAFGIWNGASLEFIEFTQKYDAYEIIYRLPSVVETESWRTYGFFGPRFVWFWEQFKWTAESSDQNGQFNPVWNAIYTNIISNRMYGIKIGCTNDWYIGNGLACSCETYGTPLLDVTKTRAKYERGDKHIGPTNRRSDTDYNVAAEAGVLLNLTWYPTEGIQVHLGYDLMAYFFTKTSEQPIDFDYSALTPKYDTQLIRLIRGFEAGVSIRF
jgi:hypothetical protein